jgi:hypothetical protein
VPPSLQLEPVVSVETGDAITLACERRSKMTETVEMRMNMALGLGFQVSNWAHPWLYTSPSEAYCNNVSSIVGGTLP